MKRFLLFLTFIFSIMTAFSQEITGEWEGALSIQNTTLRLVFHINKTDIGYSATMDSPDQGAKGIKMSHITFENALLTIELRIATIKYTGTLDKNTINGTYSQAGQSMPLVLTKSEKASVKTEEKVDINAGYIETPIILQTNKGKLFGTLTTPKNLKNGPLAIIIAGSGPTDRNCNNPAMTNDAYKKLAHELAEKNISTLRYDKRGIAESVASVESESDLVFDDYVNDAKDWIQLVKQDKRFSQIVVIGHSEGSMIGMLAAVKADKFVSVAGIGQSAATLLKEQLSAQPKELQDLSFPIIDSLVLGKKVENVNPMVMSLFRPSVQPYIISWFKYNPLTEIEKLKVPVLIIQGSADIQVGVDDAKRLSSASPQSKLLIIDKMNHILRTVDGDRQANLETYNNAALPLADGLVKEITDFILKM